MTVAVVFVALFTIEAIVEVATKALPTLLASDNRKIAAAFIVAVGVAFMLPDFDLFHLVGVTVVPWWAAKILTGFIASRGSQAVHDFLALGQGVKDAVKELTRP